jgi:hypothetical protein
LLEIDIDAPFFVASDNAGQKRLMLLTSKVMTGEQRSTDSYTLILVVLSQNVRHLYYQLMDLQKILVEVGWPPQARSVTRVKIALPEARKPFLGCSFSNRVFSVDGTNVSGGLCSFGASIELVKKAL